MNEQKTWPEAVAELRAAGRRLWLAGVGTVAALGEAGGRLFDELVEKGERVDRGGLRRGVERAGAEARRLGGRVGTAVEEGVEAGLVRLGVPTRDDVAKLAARVEQLNRKIDRLAGQA